jgi:hypothetical protein
VARISWRSGFVGAAGVLVAGARAAVIFSVTFLKNGIALSIDEKNYRIV